MSSPPTGIDGARRCLLALWRLERTRFQRTARRHLVPLTEKEFRHVHAHLTLVCAPVDRLGTRHHRVPPATIADPGPHPGHDEPAALPHFDLTDSPTSITDRLAPLLTAIGPTIGYALVVDDRLHPAHLDASPTTTGGIRHHRLVEHVVGVLADSSVRLQGNFATTAIVAGGPWWSLSGPADSRTLPDPAHSPFAREHAALGVPVLESKTALADSLATDPALAEQVSAALTDALADIHDRRAARTHAQAISGQDRRALDGPICDR